MEHQVIVLVCPQCGAPIKQNTKECGRCYSPIITVAPNAVKKQMESLENTIKTKMKEEGESAEYCTALGICQLQRGLHKHAEKYFEKAIEMLPDDGDAFYYAAIALLGGKRPFLSPLPVIRKALEYLEQAQNMNDSGAYLHLQALIHQDYFEKKMMNASPSSTQLFAQAEELGLTEDMAAEIKRMIGI